MEKILSANEYDLVSFFGILPTQVDPDLPWVYNDSLYEATDGRVYLSFAIAPSVRDVRVILKTGEVTVYELNAMGILDVRHHGDKGRESLEVLISPQHSVWLRLKSGISIRQEFIGQR